MQLIMASSQYSHPVDDAEEHLEALRTYKGPTVKRRRLAEAGKVRWERYSHRAALMHLIEYLVVQEGREPQLKKIKNFQVRQAMQFYKFMTAPGNEEIKEQLREEFEWVISDEFAEFFQTMWKNITDAGKGE